MTEDLDLSSFGDVQSIKVKDPHPAENNFVFWIGNEVLVTIKADGTIERGPAFTTNDEASLKFWEVLSTCFPVFLQGATKARAA